MLIKTRQAAAGIKSLLRLFRNDLVPIHFKTETKNMSPSKCLRHSCWSKLFKLVYVSAGVCFLKFSRFKLKAEFVKVLDDVTACLICESCVRMPLSLWSHCQHAACDHWNPLMQIRQVEQRLATRHTR